MARIQGQFQHLVYSPRGGIEGVLIASADGPVQIVFDKHDDESPEPWTHLRENQRVVIEAMPSGPSSKGESMHPVHDFVRLVSVDGQKPARRRAASGAAYRGVVARFNYARHGAANGVVLDTGDFIHTKPDGLATLGLGIGDTVEADGDAQMLSTGAGWAVEATRVNGKAVGRG